MNTIEYSLEMLALAHQSLGLKNCLEELAKLELKRASTLTILDLKEDSLKAANETARAARFIGAVC